MSCHSSFDVDVAGSRFRLSRARTKTRHPRWVQVVQMFNHQTHHRGQATTLLMQRGIDPGVTDLMWFAQQDEPS